MASFTLRADFCTFLQTGVHTDSKIVIINVVEFMDSCISLAAIAVT